MKSKAFLALLAMGIALMLPLMAAADEPDPLVLTVDATGYHEEVTGYEWTALATVTSDGAPLDAVDLIAGGHISLNYDLAVTRTAQPTSVRHGFRGDVVIENNINEELTALEMLLNLLVREGDGAWTLTDYEITVPVDVDDSVLVPYDFEIDIDDFITLNQETMNFAVVATITHDAVVFDDTSDGLLALPDDPTDVDVNRAAVVDADFVWLHLSNPVAFPDGVTLLTSPASQSWLLDTGNLIDGTVNLELLAVLGTLGYDGDSNLAEDALRLDISITPADSIAFAAYSHQLPVNITVPATGSHSVHFYVTGGHGSVTAWMGTSELHLGATIATGSQLRFEATPEAGYKVKQWTINNIVQGGTGLVLNIQYLAVNTVVTVEFAPVDTMQEDDDDDEEDGNQAAPAIANMILRQHNIPHRIATTTLKKNGKATYINLISEVARQNRGNSFMGVDRANQTAFYNAVYNYLKQLGAQLP